jgi:hypothetical protein
MILTPDFRTLICGALVGRPSASWGEVPAGVIPALARRLADTWGVAPSSADMALRRYLRDGADMGGDRLATLIAEVGIEVVPAKGRWT